MRAWSRNRSRPVRCCGRAMDTRPRRDACNSPSAAGDSRSRWTFRPAAVLRHAHRPQEANPVGLGDLVRDLSEFDRRDAGYALRHFEREWLETFLYSSKRFTHPSMNAVFARPVWRMLRDGGHPHHIRARIGRSRMSARRAISFSRRSATTNRCPRNLCARFTRVASTGWLSAVLLPTMTTRPALSIS